MKHLLILFFAASMMQVGAQEKPVALDMNLQNFPYPFPVQYISLQSQGKQLRLAYMDVKPAKPNGRTVTLLHGKNFSGAYWKNVAEALQAQGYRVIIPDQIGFGRSTKPDHLQYTFQLLATHTRQLLDTLKVSRTSVVGHSMGGMLAVRFSLMYPDRVEKLVLENPIGLEDWKLKVPYADVDTWYKRELGQNYESIRKYQQENYYHGTWKPEYDQWLNMLAGWTMHPDYKRVAWNSALTYDMIFTQPVVYEFGQLKVPVLLIIGQLDRTALGKQEVPAEVRRTMGNYPELGRRTRQAIKNAELVELQGVGHLPHIEAFNEFIAPLLTYLR
ncbi:MAG TPA: alpha/beta hydrolase [Chitinophagaceae bacterium]|nr:alpha/beta hydrolase [Chitinophagaceae bacterium]